MKQTYSIVNIPVKNIKIAVLHGKKKEFLYIFGTINTHKEVKPSNSDIIDAIDWYFLQEIANLPMDVFIKINQYSLAAQVRDSDKMRAKRRQRIYDPKC